MDFPVRSVCSVDCCWFWDLVTFGFVCGRFIAVGSGFSCV